MSLGAKDDRAAWGDVKFLVMEKLKAVLGAGSWAVGSYSSAGRGHQVGEWRMAKRVLEVQES